MDKERLGESEEVLEYLICVIRPLSGEYEPGGTDYYDEREYEKKKFIGCFDVKLSFGG